MQFAVCNEMFEGWRWADTCQFAASLGYDSVELAPFTVAEDVRQCSSADRERLRAEAEQAGTSIIGLHWLLVKPAGLHLTSPDVDLRKGASQYLLELARFCSDLGGNVMVLGSPKQRSLAEGVARSDGEKWLRDALLPVADAAGSLGITLCLEPLPAEDTNFINTLEEAAQLVEAWNHPAIRLILDVKSMGSESTPIPALIRKYGPLAAHVHANDTNRRGPGAGDTDFVPIFQALRETGYSGTVSVEVFDYSPDPQTIARESLAYMQRAAGIITPSNRH